MEGLRRRKTQSGDKEGGDDEGRGHSAKGGGMAFEMEEGVRSYCNAHHPSIGRTEWSNFSQIRTVTEFWEPNIFKYTLLLLLPLKNKNN
ncbi:hypothetical protein TNCT_638211 [Trichonephila clavata]|uniref:Uncharacterized protein n=1 Tax=Trichonephila clavata TaxID=2740835 RepID=A0A8X6KJK7_TRICU|nr:hypothetical protein TNCT_638211 [Trichonephila clavata]